MARARFQAPKGTQDILPPESARWEALLTAYATVVANNYSIARELENRR